MVNCKSVNTECSRKLGVLVEVVDDNLGYGITLKLNNNAGVFVGFIPNSRDLGQDLFVGQLSYATNQRGTVDDIRNFGNDNLLLTST